MNDFGISAMFHSEVFEAYFEPYRPPSIPACEYLNDTWIQPSYAAFQALKEIESSFVWSVVSDGGITRDVYYSPGFRVVNREAYVVTKRGHSFELIDFREYWYRPFLSDIGLKRELTRLKKFLTRCESVSGRAAVTSQTAPDNSA